LRILTFTSLFPTASNPTHCIFIYQRASHPAKIQGNNLTVVSPIPYVPAWLKIDKWRALGDVAGEESLGGLPVFHPRYLLVPKISMLFHSASMFLGSLACVARLHKHSKFDCIDAHFVYPDGMAAVLLGKLLRIPVIVSARGTDINSYSSIPIVRSMIRWTLAHADAVIAVSSALKNAIVSLGTAPEKVHVIPNGIDSERFRPLEPAVAREQLNLAPDAKFIVSVGALIPLKGQQLLIRAFEQIARRHSALNLYIIGEGPLRAELIELIDGLGLRDRIYLLGKRSNEDLRLWFSAATASCIASMREGWPNVATESLACGTPVIATRVGGIPEILHKPELGIIVEQTPNSLASGLESALARAWDREGIARETHQRTWDVVAAEVKSVLAAQVALRAELLRQGLSSKRPPNV